MENRCALIPSQISVFLRFLTKEKKHKLSHFEKDAAQIKVPKQNAQIARMILTQIHCKL